MHFRLIRRDLRATLIAAAGTLVTVLLNGPSPELHDAAIEQRDPMEGLIGADRARSEGA